MHIAVMGAGAVGGYFGALLARAGNPVTMIARGPHLQAMQKRGLEIRSHWGNFTVRVKATSDPSAVGPVDLVLHTLKTYQNSQAISAMQPMIGPDTALITLQNGVNSYQDLASAFGKERVLPGAAYIETIVVEPGTIQQSGGVVRLVFGEISGPPSPRCYRILETFTGAGITADASDNIMKELWSKFLFISVLAGVTTASNARLSDLLPHTHSRDLVTAAMREVEAIGRARGVALDEDIVPKILEYMDGWASDLTASMHTDLELGRPLELEALTGAVVSMGRDSGIPTPVNDTLYALLVVHKSGYAGKSN